MRIVLGRKTGVAMRILVEPTEGGGFYSRLCKGAGGLPSWIVRECGSVFWLACFCSVFILVILISYGMDGLIAEEGPLNLLALLHVREV